MWNAYLNSNVATLKNTMLYSLGCSCDEALLKQLLESTLNNNKGIRTQDINSVYQSVVNSKIGFNLIKDFLNENIKAIFER